MEKMIKQFNKEKACLYLSEEQRNSCEKMLTNFLLPQFIKQTEGDADSQKQSSKETLLKKNKEFTYAKLGKIFKSMGDFYQKAMTNKKLKLKDMPEVRNKMKEEL